MLIDLTFGEEAEFFVFVLRSIASELRGFALYIPSALPCLLVLKTQAGIFVLLNSFVGFYTEFCSLQQRLPVVCLVIRMSEKPNLPFIRGPSGGLFGVRS